MKRKKKSLVKNIQKVSNNYTVVSYKVNSKYRKCSVFFFRIFTDKKNRNKISFISSGIENVVTYTGSFHISSVASQHVL